MCVIYAIQSALLLKWLKQANATWVSSPSPMLQTRGERLIICTIKHCKWQLTFKFASVFCHSLFYISFMPLILQEGKLEAVPQVTWDTPHSLSGPRDMLSMICLSSCDSNITESPPNVLKSSLFFGTPYKILKSLVRMIF